MNANDLCFLSAIEQRQLLSTREISAVELVSAYIDRIEQHNPTLNAFVTLRLDEALDEAKAADSAIANGRATGVLHGLPIGVKDCFQTAGLRTTMGCAALADHIPNFDHSVVAREKAAGAIVLGKLNTPEFTMASNICDNPVFGTTRNPWNLNLCPGVSSGGSAAALAAGLCTLADGSDIGGSVRNPAAWCNIVGHRPTAWMVPDVPNTMPWHNMNTPGPMARCVADAELFLSAIAGPHPQSPVAVPAPFPPGLPILERQLDDVRVGWSCDHGSLQMDPDIVSNFVSQVRVFESLGCSLVERDVDMCDVELMYNVLCYERVAADVAPIYTANRVGLDAGLAKHYERIRDMSGDEFMKAHQMRNKLWRDVCAAFEECDVLVWPNDTHDAYGCDDIDTAEKFDWRLLYVAPLLGLPAITVPCGFSASGVPRGLQIIGSPGADMLIAQVGFAFERATDYGAAKPPIDE